MDEIVVLSLSKLENMVSDIVKQTIDELEARTPKKIRMYSPKQVCEQLNISESTFRRHVKNGSIKSKKVGGQIRVSDEDLKSAITEIKNMRYKR